MDLKAPLGAVLTITGDLRGPMASSTAPSCGGCRSPDGDTVHELDADRSPEDDRERARAIPIIGPMSGGGAIPGTVPHRQRRLDRLERALKRGSAGTVHGDGHRGRG